MADEDENKKGDALAGEPAGGDSSGGSGALGPILALLVVIGLGIAIAFLVQRLLTTDPEQEDGETDEGPKAMGPLFETHAMIELGEILANVKGERGRRYVKVDMQIWVTKEDFPKVSREEIIPSLKAAVQDELRSWNISDYEGEHIDETMEHQFTEAINKTLRDILNEPNLERTYVKRVVFNYLVQ